MRILVVDDKPLNLKAAEGQFRALGHEVITVESYKPALQLIINQKFDAVLTDLFMPLEKDDLESIAQLVDTDPNDIWFSDGYVEHPTGLAVWDTAIAKKVPYVGMLSSIDKHRLASVIMNTVEPAVDNALGLEGKPRFIDNSLCFRSNTSEFNGYSLRNKFEKVISLEDKENIQKKHSWSEKEKKELWQSWANAKNRKQKKTASDKYEDYTQRNPVKSYASIKNWAKLLQYLVDNDPRSKINLDSDFVI